MLKIRLQRIGKRNQAYFRVVVTEHTQKPKGRYLELLGSYDPHKNNLQVNADRVKYWLSQGAKLSGTVNNLLVGGSIIEGKKVRVWKPKKKGQPAESVTAVGISPPTGTKKVEETKIEEKIEEKKEETTTGLTPLL